MEGHTEDDERARQESPPALMGPRGLACLQRVLEATRFLSGPAYFEALVRAVSGELEAHVVLVGHLLEDGHTVETSAIAVQGSLQPKLRYDLAGTPCERVVGHEACVFPRDIVARFPEDHLLVELGAESYAGAPTLDGNSKAIGIFAMLDTKTIEDVEEARAFAEAIASLISSEIGHLTTRRALEHARREAEAANRLKSALLANVSHEIRTPLNGILGSAQLLEETRLDPRQGVLLRHVIDGGESLLALLSDVLDLSMLQAGQLEPQPEAFDPARLLLDLVEARGELARAKGLRLDLETRGLSDRVLADTTHLRRVIENLLDNALKFTETGSVHLSASLLAGRGRPLLRVEVEDTGPGVPRERVEQLFDTFVQGDGSATRRHGGTGLGLALSKGLVALLGGRIGYHPGLRGGSVFWFEVPVETSDASEEEADVPQDALLGREILLVEDNDVNRLIATRLLERLGARVTSCENGAAALDWMATTTFDGVVMDCQMPVMDGLGATRRLRARGDETPIVALTANAREIERRACLDAGMDDFLQKPARPEHLLSSLGRLLPVRTAPTGS